MAYQHATADLRRAVVAAAARPARLKAGRAARPGQPGPHRVTLLGLAVALPVLAMLLATTSGWSLASYFTPAPAPLEAQQQAQQTLDRLVAGVEAFREDYGELPSSLSEIEIPSSGTWRYSATGENHYTVEGAIYGQRVRFDSAQANPW